jgi:NAD(P)H-hydrate repair Nnr-like enzyme with NAD(P)H-hydrate epimerase domain
VSPVPFEPDPAALAALARDAIEFDVIVDGIVGTGTTTGSAGSPALRGTARAVVEALLPALSGGPEGPEGAGGPDIVAVDIPSGIDPDTGAAPDPAVLPATVTVTFGGIKAGLLRGDGAALAGRVVLIEIGIEDDLAAVTPAIELPAVKLT